MSETGLLGHAALEVVAYARAGLEGDHFRDWGPDWNPKSQTWDRPGERWRGPGVSGTLVRSGDRWMFQVLVELVVKDEDLWRGFGSPAELLSFATELSDRTEAVDAVVGIDRLSRSPADAHPWLIDMAHKYGALTLIPKHLQDVASESLRVTLGSLVPLRSITGVTGDEREDGDLISGTQEVRIAELDWLAARLLRSGERWLLQVTFHRMGDVPLDADLWRGFGDPADLLSFAAELSGGAEAMEAITNIDLLGRSPSDAHPWLIDMARRNGALTLLPQRLQEDVSESLREALVEGRSAHIAVGIATAQALARKLRSGYDLDLVDEGTARALLTEAPFVLGYWSAIKLLLKSGIAFRFPEEAGTALARLSLMSSGSLASRTQSSGFREFQFERVHELEAANRVASPATVQYMTRRLRRDLRSLSSSDPDRYVAIAATVLRVWDSAVLPRSYIPSYILHGDNAARNSRGWRVRRGAFEESLPEANLTIWGRHLDLVRLVFADVRSSFEALHWAFGILEYFGQAPDSLEGPQITLAMREPATTVAGLACSSLANNPSVGLVTERAWCSFFEHATPAQFTRALTQLESEETFARRPEFVESCSIAGALQSTLIAANLEPERLRMIGRLYIRVAAVIQPSNWTCGFDRQDVAMPIAASLTLAAALGDPLETAELLKELPTVAVVHAFSELAGNLEVNDSDLDPLASHILLRSSRQSARRIAFQFFGDGNRRSAHLGWRLLQRAQPAEKWFVTDERHPEFGRSIQYSTWEDGAWRANLWPPPQWNVESLLLGLLDTQDVDIVLQALDGLLTLDWLDIPDATIAKVLAAHQFAPEVVWLGLARGTRVAEAFLTAADDGEVRAAVLNGVGPAWVRQSGPEHEELLLEWLAGGEPLEEDMLVACIESPLARVQRVGIEAVTRSGLLPDLWLRLAETGTPVALEAASKYFASLRGSERTNAVLLAIDSSAPPLRDLGLAFLDGDQGVEEPDAVWAALAESEDPVVQRRVVEEALAGREIPTLADLDRRVLLRRRQGRATKELVKSRFESSHTGDALSPERASALLDMARGRNRRDRSWALQRIALLSTAGVALEGVDVTFAGDDDE